MGNFKSVLSEKEIKTIGSKKDAEKGIVEGFHSNIGPIHRTEIDIYMEKINKVWNKIFFIYGIRGNNVGPSMTKLLKGEIRYKVLRKIE